LDISARYQSPISLAVIKATPSWQMTQSRSSNSSRYLMRFEDMRRTVRRLLTKYGYRQMPKRPQRNLSSDKLS
jgi:hypothetical protein